MSEDNAYGEFLRAALGAVPESSAGPPFTHTLKLPETEEEMAAAPLMPTMSVLPPPPGAHPRRS